MSLNSYQQAEKLAMIAREHHLKAHANTDLKGYKIGKKRYHNQIDFSCALLSAFKQVGIQVPEELSVRPIDLT